MTEEKNAANEVQEGKFFACIGYLWILCLVPLFLKKDNEFARFHGKQGLVLFIGEIAISIIGIVPILGWIVFFFGSLLFGCLALAGMVNALLGNRWKIPVIADIAESITI